MRSVLRVRSAIAALSALPLLAAAASAQTPTPPSAAFDALRFRSIGPAVTGGRLHDVEALPHDPSTVYAAAASGGLWKSVNKGTTWTPIFDDQPVSTFGDLAIAPSNPAVLWVGTGEQNNRQSTSWGNGVYRSDDAGRTWRHVGLEATHHIGRVQVHPENPEIAWVAALGNLWKPTPDRGVYRTVDGGGTWEKVLYVDTLTGVVDLVLDPSNPDVLYAAAYQRLRKTWGYNGGGPGSGIYKTVDGGRTWRRLSAGLPSGDLGRIGLAIAASNPRVLNATVEHATESGTYRTADGGETWRRVHPLNRRPAYYSHIYIDPTDENRVFVLSEQFHMSEDGGRTFRQLPTASTYDVGIHGDFHALWIDPKDSRHLYLVGDGGINESWDRGATYIRMNQLPVAQFYAIGLDGREPFRIYGGLQDNHSWFGPSRTRSFEGIFNDDWRQIGFGDGMFQQPDPSDPRFVYSNAQDGELTRVDPETGDILDIRPHPPAGEPPYRFDWTTPSLISRHDPRVVYFGGNRLFISRDRGVSWQRTADLTRQIDRDTLRLMGVAGRERLLSKNDGASSFGEIVAIAESPLDARILWVGTDDGNIQVSRDGGTTWTEVGRNLRGVPNMSLISRVEASRAGPGVAYVTVDAHQIAGDFAPYLFRTDDFGRTWRPLMAGLPSGVLNVIREHPRNPNLLFLGSEHALHVSTDGGRSWSRLKANLPTTLYDDLAIHPRDDDLVVATHGRSLWVLDDLTALVRWSAAAAAQPAHLFPPRPATIFQYRKDTSYRGNARFAGENPPVGANLDYHLSRAAADARTLTPSGASAASGPRIEIADAAGRVVRRLPVPGSAGVIHRVYWDLRHEPPPARSGPGSEPPAGAPPAPQPIGPRGPLVAPGSYVATLIAGDARSVQTVTVRADPLLQLSAADWRGREAFLVEVAAMQRDVAAAAGQAARLRSGLVARIDSLQAGGGGAPADILARRDSSTILEDRLGVRPGVRRGLRGELDNLAAEFNGNGVRQGSLFPPTETHRRRKNELATALKEVLDRLERLEGR